MAKMKKQEIESIVRREMPGFHLASKASPSVEADAAQNRPPTDAETPDLQALRRKYIRVDSQKSARPATGKRDAGSRGEDTDDDEIVAVEPDEALPLRDRAARAKAVVVSGKNKKIVGKQG